VRPYLLVFGAGLATLLSGATSTASPLDQIRSASGLTGLDLERLKRGDIVTARGPLGSFPRGVYTEACYFVRRPIESVGEKLLHWDTSKQPELKVSILREYNWPAPSNVFDQLALSSSRAKDKWLIDHTWEALTSGKPGELFVTASEVAASQLSPEHRDAKVNAFWKKILALRDRAAATGGLNALPHFNAGKIDISIHGEFDGLMTLAPKVASHFKPLIGARPLTANGSSPTEIVPYWQDTLVRDHTTLHAGFLAAQKMKSWQVADCTYFTSDTYFMSVTFYELFPVENGTLVWQIDFVSAPFRSYLGGADRFFAGNEIVKETAKTIQLFRAHAEK
jgi:hypothetical protein